MRAAGFVLHSPGGRIRIEARLGVCRRRVRSCSLEAAGYRWELPRDLSGISELIAIVGPWEDQISDELLAALIDNTLRLSLAEQRAPSARMS